LDRLSDYDYDLPDELIAQTPLADRAASRLLWLHKSGGVEDRQFRTVPEILQPGDVLVMNDTRVSAVRLLGRKSTGAAVEALLLREVEDGRYQALVKPGKRLQPGAQIDFGHDLRAKVLENFEEGLKLLEFERRPDLREKLDEVGMVPLPPYIHETLSDKERYQTVYGVNQGSAAAPTAGLHFTSEMLALLQERGVRIANVTLHVGLDTFRPVQVEDLGEHQMHGELCEISEQSADLINRASGRVIAVGTTSVRTVESLAIGPKAVSAGNRQTKLFIRPGYEFKIVDGMFTNFHLPRTTMLVMLSAMIGRNNLLQAYGHAVEKRYRFLSFGDSMLIL
jgi:S-adenosylmethionine:tRNA ribosyltransferase-isomerase